MGVNATDSFNSKAKIAGQTDSDGEIYNAKIMIPLKYLSNFWRTVEMSLINCEVDLILTWSANCAIVFTNVANQDAMFAITEDNAKLYQLKIMQNYYHNQNQVLKQQLIGTNIYQNKNY